MSVLHFRAFLQRVIFAVITIAFVIGVAVTPAKSQKHIEDLEIFDLILQIKRGPLTLSEGIFALQQNEDYYLPLKELARLVEFPVTVDVEENTIEGWFFKEDNVFLIDLEQSVYITGGQTKPFKSGDVIIERRIGTLSEAYVHIDLLNEIWPLNLEVDFGRLIMNIKTPLRLPFEAREDRLSKRQQLLVDQAGNLIDRSTLVQIDNPYKLISKPIINLDKTINWNNNGLLSSNVSVAGQSDLLGFQADYGANFSYSEDGLQEPEVVSLRLRRQDFDGEPMIFGARRVLLGDIGAPVNRLIGASSPGRGLQISSRPTFRDIQFDEVTIDGLATPGYEIELYQNNQLIDFGFVPESGEYRFDNITLFSGVNIIKVILYGPEGQVEERVETFDVSRALLEPGEFNYDFSVVDVGERFLPYGDADDTRGEGIAYNASVDLGVNRWISLFASNARVVQRDGEDDYVSAGLNFSAFSGSGRFEVLKQVSGGEAYDIRYLTGLMGWRTNFQTTYYNDFETQNTFFGDSAREFEFMGAVSRTFRVPFGSLGLRFGLDHEITRSGNAITRFEARQSLLSGKFRFNNNLRIFQSDTSDRFTTGIFSANTRLSKRWNVRSRFNYTLEPEKELTGFNALMRYRGENDFSGAIIFDHNLTNDSSEIGLQLSKDFDTFLGSVNLDWDTKDTVSLFLRGSTTIAPFGKDGEYIARSQDLRRNKALQARIFEDKDGDGIFGEGDELVPGASVRVDGSLFGQSDEDGQLLILDPAPSGERVVTFDQFSSENPFLVSSITGYNALLRPGTKQTVDIPLVESGAIDGVAYFAGGEPVPGLRVQLVSEDGEVVNTTITAFDGFYNFEFVLPGNYIVQADPTQRVFVAPRSVSVTSEEIFAYGIDLIILEQIEEVPTQIGIESEIGEVAPSQNAQADLRLELKGLSPVQPEGRPAFRSLAVSEDHFTSAPDESSDSSNLRREAEGRPTFLGPRPLGEGTLRLKPDGEIETRDRDRAEIGEVAPSLPNAWPKGVERSSSASTSDDGALAVVNQVEIGEDQNGLRIQLVLSGPADYRLAIEDDGEQIILFLPDTKWLEDQDLWTLENSDLVTFVKGRLLEGGGSIMTVTAKDRVRIKDVFVVRPTKTGDYNLIMELSKP